MAKKDTYKYELHDGHKTVYVGTTKDPERREAEHRADGKDFTNMTIIGRPSTWEAPRIRLEPADCRPDCRRLDRLWSRCPTPRAGTGGHPPLRTLPPRLRTGRLWNVILLVSSCIPFRDEKAKRN